VRFSSEVCKVEQRPQAITALIKAGRNSQKVSGRFLIGADGARSAVRESLGIPFEGFTWPERFLVVSTPFPFEETIDGLAPVSYFADPEEWFFLLRVPGLWRAMFPTRPDETDASVVSDASIERRLQRVVAKTHPYEVRHRTLYRVHQRVAERYREGLAFLAGDAAHINNPLGGMGMNGGIHDGVNLAEKIAEAWNSPDAQGLDAYERQRRPIALDYVNVHSTENKMNLEAKDAARQTRFRNTLRDTQADPRKAYAYLLEISMITSLKKAAML
jgi:3-(3-hydroxy-phenyl)propionate hydroxylase